MAIQPPDDAAHLDAQLMHDLTVVNAQLSRYVLRFLGTGVGGADPVPPAEERALADQVQTAADGIRARATRREQQDGAIPRDDHVDEK